MKKIVLVLVLFFILFVGKAKELIIPIGIEKQMVDDARIERVAEHKVLNNSNFFSSGNSTVNFEKIEYKVTLNNMVSKEEFERVKLRLKQDNAPFEIVDVDFKAMTVHIKLQNKVPYDQIEKVFGSVRLNVVKIESLF